MALIKCPECGRDVSDQAASCPGCGYPVPQALAQRGNVGYGRSMTAEETEAYLEEVLAAGGTITSSDTASPVVKILAVLALIVLIPIQLVLIFVTSISSWIFTLLGAFGGLLWLVSLIFYGASSTLKAWPVFAASLVCFMLPSIAAGVIGVITAATEKLKNCITS